MGLTKEQIEFLDKVCKGKWTLNENGEVDVDGNVDIIQYKTLSKIPVKFGEVSGWFDCQETPLTTLENFPDIIGINLNIINTKIKSFDYFPKIKNLNSYSVLTVNNIMGEYFKSIKEEDFPYWEILNWFYVLKEYPFLINITKKYFSNDGLRYYLDRHPLTKLYLK